MPFLFKVAIPRDFLLGMMLLAIGCRVSGNETQGGIEPIGLRHSFLALSQDQGTMGSLPSSSNPPKENRLKKVLYVSTAMGIDGIQEAILEADRLKPHPAQMTVVFQGLPEGETLKVFSQQIRNLLPCLKEGLCPLIHLDPIRFSQHHIVKVPVLMLEDHDHIIQHESQTLTPTVKVSEENLIDRLKARMKAFDWAKAKNDLEQAVIHSFPMMKLPEATQRVSRTFTLSMRVPYDLRTPEGTLLAGKGAIINPLTLPLPPLHLWVFDPLAVSQLKATLRLLRDHPNSSITLIASQWDQQQGLKGLEQLEIKLNHPVTLLTPLLQERLGITHLPIEIIQEGERLHLQEIPPKSDPA